MTTYLGKSCSFGLLSVFLTTSMYLCKCASFPICFEGGMRDLIEIIHNYCLFSIYFVNRLRIKGHSYIACYTNQFNVDWLGFKSSYLPV